MKIKMLTAAIAAMLCLTACGETNKADTTSEKPADAATESAEYEEVTTEPVTEEVTTETTPAVETTVTTTTEATTTTSATTTTAPAPAEPEKEEFKLAEGLSEKYVDFDNMALEYNGHIFKFGEATVQDFLDAGVELFSDELDDDHVAYYDDVEAQVKVNDTIRADLTFAPWSDSSNARDCVLWRFKINLINSPYDKVTWGTNYGEGMVHTNIPLRLKKDELIANSGEPVDMHSGSIGGSLICKYTAPSFKTPDRDDMCSQIKFSFYNGDLATISFSAHETQY
ncbi:MAG: hypothetical protein E7494_00185 [Ruminococcus albus]|jgi:hypothetical protein|nr:hypothetical protein [Ruminococcus albus]